RILCGNEEVESHPEARLLPFAAMRGVVRIVRHVLRAVPQELPRVWLPQKAPVTLSPLFASRTKTPPSLACLSDSPFAPSQPQAPILNLLRSISHCVFGFTLPFELVEESAECSAPSSARLHQVRKPCAKDVVESPRRIRRQRGV